MTIQGAILELQNLLKADDVPFYYKGGIEKVIETIQMELADRKTEPSGYKMKPFEQTEPTAQEYEKWLFKEPQTEHGFSAKAMCSTKLFEAEPQTCDTCRYDKEPWHRQVCDECTVGESNWKPKDEPQLAEKCPFDDSLPCEWVCTEYGKCKYKPQTEPIPHDDYIESGNDHLEARCLNCHNAKDCKENHWEVCKFEPWKLTAVDDEPQTERESD